MINGFLIDVIVYSLLLFIVVAVGREVYIRIPKGWRKWIEKGLKNGLKNIMGRS